MLVYYKLKDVLNRKGLRDYQLAKMTGMSVSTVSKMMNGKTISSDCINRVCKVLSVQPSDIMEFVPDIEDEATSTSDRLTSDIAES